MFLPIFYVKFIRKSGKHAQIESYPVLKNENEQREKILFLFLRFNSRLFISNGQL